MTLREALLAVGCIAVNQSDTLNGFVFSKEGYLAQIDDRPLLGKDDDYRVIATRFEKKDGATELHFPTSEILKRNIQDYAKISLFDFTFGEFAEMAVLFPTYFSTLRKEIEEWLAKADYKEAAKTFADLLEKRQKEDDVRDLPKEKESITKADVERFRLRAEVGVPEMQTKYAMCLLWGWGVEQNETEAVKWLRKASGQGYAEAQFVLGSCHFNCTGVEQDYSEAERWYLEAVKGFHKAAGYGDAKAQLRLGFCYSQGFGVAQDYHEAERWYQEAVKWYLNAAEQGNTQAQCVLGKCYFHGEGVEEDDAEAVKWYRKAAEQGDGLAQLRLGFCYATGKGIAQNNIEAVKWFRKAAKSREIEQSIR